MLDAAWPPDVYGRPFVKRFALMLSDRCHVLSCPVYGVGVLWLNGWMDMKLGVVVLGLGCGHIVIVGDPAPPSYKGAQPPIFGPCQL